MNGQLDLVKSVSYIFDDKDWVSKVGILLLVNLAFSALSFILIGFIFLAAQLGWIIGLIRNMQAGDETPMPAWNDFGGMMKLGLSPMGASIVYSLIPGVIACLLFAPAILAGSVSEEAGGVFGLGVTCLIIPLFIVYAAVAILAFTVGTIRYASSESISEYFNFSGIISTLQQDTSLTTRFFVFVIVIQLVLGAVSSTGIGSLVTLAFSTPVLGHLMGQYALALGGGKKKKAV